MACFMVLALAVCGKGLLSVRGLMLVINSFVFLLVSVGITYLYQLFGLQSEHFKYVV